MILETNPSCMRPTLQEDSKMNVLFLTVCSPEIHVNMIYVLGNAILKVLLSQGATTLGQPNLNSHCPTGFVVDHLMLSGGIIDANEF